MAGIFDLFGKDDPAREQAMTAFLADGGGLLSRLAAYRQAKASAPIVAERQRILREALTPGQAEEAQISVSPGQDPVEQALRSASQPSRTAGLLPTAGAPTFARPADAPPLVLASAGNPASAPADTGFMPRVDRKVTREARPASFDVDTAVARLRSIGDIETADSLLNGEYKQALAGARAAGKGEKWYANRQLVRGSDGKMYHQILSDAGNAKLVPIDGDLAGELKQMDVGGQKMWVNPYTGQPVRGFAVTPTAYQNWQMDDGAQAGQALAVESAKVTGRIGAEKSADYAEKGDKASDALAELDSLTGALGKLSSPLYTKYQNVAGFVGAGDEDYQRALGEVDRASGRMLAYVERLPGAATDGDRDIFMASAGVLRNPNLPIPQRIAAAEAAKASFRRLVEKYGRGAAPYTPVPTVPRPTRPAAPQPASTIQVRAPNGKVYTFPDKKSADNFKLKAGIR